MGNLFKSYLMGGFECSTHRIGGKRLDLIDSTKHDEFAEIDYQRLIKIGMNTARDGVRWHLIERKPFEYDFSSLEKQIRAVKNTGIQIVWDLFHYGYPDDLDILSPEFIERFTKFCVATVEFIHSELNENLLICPVNEISFYSWAAGEVGVFHPFLKNRGDELKDQLIKTSISAIKEIRKISPETRFVQTDPAIHVSAPKKATKFIQKAAENYRRSQFHAFDMLSGKRKPELGGKPEYLDIIGLNYYFHNQWRYPSRRKISLGHPEYRPLHLILEEFYQRYQRPMFIAETGIEDHHRPHWFRYVCEEVEKAKSINVPVEGICLYPIVNHPGWADNRHCHNGLWDYADNCGEREIFQPLADEIISQISAK
ncbi:MAG: hypothetical protein K1X72_26485 [Pyrinomonadaceae bacterium]|nr:hypothetical protein [Pyrinomonadaceae bacterium]